MGEVTVTQCPNCGGPVDPRAYKGVTDPKCPHCQFALPVAPDPPPPREIRIDVSGATRTARRGRAGLVIFILVMVIGLPIAIAVIAAISTSGVHHAISSLGGGSSITIDGPVVPASGTDVFSIARSQTTQTETLVRVDPVHRKTLWTSTPLDQQSEGTPTIVAGSGGTVMAIYSSTVVGFDATTGRRLWQGSLSNGLANPCTDPCAVIVGARLVALSKDGVVQALDTATGAQAWSKRLAATPRYLEPAGGSVVTIDTPTSSSDRVADVINATTGALHQIAPSCAPDPDLPDLVAKPDEDDEFFVSGDGTALTVLIPGNLGCVGHYRLADGAALWVTPPANTDNGPVPFSLTGNSAAQGAGTLLWTTDHSTGYTVYALNESNGAIRALATFAKSSVKLDGIVGSLAVVDVAPTYDSEKPAVVAVDLATGAQKWTVATRVRLSGDTQKTVLSPAAPVIVSCSSSGDTCTFEAIDPQTGTIKGTSGPISATPSQTDEVAVAVIPSALVATVGWSHAAALDPATAAVRWTWPS